MLNRKRTRCPSKRGFSLIEVLVAFVILSLSLAVIFQIFSVNLRNASAIDRYTKATVIADSRLALLGTEIPIETGEISGSEGDYFWRMTIARYEDESLGTNGTNSAGELYDIEIEVQWQLGSKTNEIRLNTLRVAAAP